MRSDKVLLFNLCVVAMFVLLAHSFGKWWIVLFAVLFMNYNEHRA